MGMNFKYSKKAKNWEVLTRINPFIYSDIASGNIEKENNIAVIRDYPIHSVKRIKDGEVFSVGDKVEYTSIFLNEQSGNYELKKAIIKSFEIKDNSLFVLGHNGFFISTIDRLSKIKQ